MNFFLLKSKSFFIALLHFVFFELLSYVMLNKHFFYWTFARKDIWYFLLIEFALIAFSFLWFMSSDFWKKEKAMKFVLPLLLGTSIFLSLFSFSFLLFHQIIIFLSFFFFFLIFINIEKENIRFRFINAASFLSAFLFFFGIYFLIYTLLLPYWLAIIMVIIFSSLLLHYKLTYLDINRNEKNLFLILFAIIISEIFLVSLFWPIPSLFLKSIILVATYYFYWGIIDLHIRKLANKNLLLIYIIIFILLMILITISLLLKILI